MEHARQHKALGPACAECQPIQPAAGLVAHRELGNVHVELGGITTGDRTAGFELGVARSDLDLHLTPSRVADRVYLNLCKDRVGLLNRLLSHVAGRSPKGFGKLVGLLRLGLGPVVEAECHPHWSVVVPEVEDSAVRSHDVHDVGLGGASILAHDQAGTAGLRGGIPGGILLVAPCRQNLSRLRVGIQPGGRERVPALVAAGAALATQGRNGEGPNGFEVVVRTPALSPDPVRIDQPLRFGDVVGTPYA